jgi:hypothetical protein
MEVSPRARSAFPAGTRCVVRHMGFMACLGKREAGMTQFEEKGSWHESAREVGRRAPPEEGGQALMGWSGSARKFFRSRGASGKDKGIGKGHGAGAPGSGGSARWKEASKAVVRR